MPDFRDLGFWVQALAFWVQGFWLSFFFFFFFFSAHGLGAWVRGAVLKVLGAGFKAFSAGSRVQGCQDHRPLQDYTDIWGFY